MKLRVKTLCKSLVCLILGLAALLGLHALYLIVSHNFHVVVPGTVYRSRQMGGSALEATMRKYGIRSVLNLRGKSFTQSWYSEETNTVALLQAQYLDIPLSAGREVTDAEIERLLTAMRNAPKPLLIHCNAGADRTGLVSALYLYSIEGRSSEESVGQLCAWYGHLPCLHWDYSIAMDNSYWRYVSNQTARAAQAPLITEKP